MGSDDAMLRPIMLACAIAAFSDAGAVHGDGTGFVHFESPHVHPLDRTPDGARLLAVNTADGRLEVFDILPGAPHLRHAGSVAVGLDPVSVRARNATQAWVVNRISDSVSIVDLASMRVVATLQTGDRPSDVAFAGTPERAFVSVSGEDRVMAWIADRPQDAPASIPIAGRSPRALASDGQRLHVAIFEGGNATTVIPAHVVSGPASPYPGAPNPPPNHGSGFDPPISEGLPPAPPTALVVRRAPDGAWRDRNGADWSAAVTWDVLAHGLATIDASTLLATHVGGLMGVPFSVEALPGGRALVVGHDARNEERFESKVNSVFLRVEWAIVEPGASAPAVRGDLNPHLDYSVPALPITERRRSIGDPRAAAVLPGGTRALVAGMGSSNIVELDLATGARLGELPVGRGPTGIALDDAGVRAFVLNRFDATISVVDVAARATVAGVGYFDATPDVVRKGRPFLFDTHLTSGLGQASCASCHIDARSDGLAWDLGNPAGGMTAFDQVCNMDLPVPHDACGSWHPMKGPMVTQSLVGMGGTEPFHWRGDRAYIANFAHTGQALQGSDLVLDDRQLKDLQDYLVSIAPEPNPLRRLDGTLPDSIGGGNPAAGESLFRTATLGFVGCTACHGGPTGAGAAVISGDLMQGSQMMAVPHLTGLADKGGFAGFAAADNRRGFGFGHDGSRPTLVDFLRVPGSHFNHAMPAGEQSARDLAAFLLAWESGTHASVGAQATVGGPSPSPAGRRDALAAIADAGRAQLVARTTVDGAERTYLHQGGVMIADRAGHDTTLAGLDAAAAAGGIVTYTLVPIGAGDRALDRDGDGFADGDERAACTDPADPGSRPGGGCRADIAGVDGRVDGIDLGALLAAWGSTQPNADLDCDGHVDGNDLGALLAAWGPCGP